MSLHQNVWVDNWAGRDMEGIKGWGGEEKGRGKEGVGGRGGDQGDWRESGGCSVRQEIINQRPEYLWNEPMRRRREMGFPSNS